MRTLCAVLRACAPAVVVATVLAMSATPSQAVQVTHRVFTQHVIMQQRVAHVATSSLSPSAQTLNFGDTATLTYTGSLTTLGAVFFDGQLLDFGAMGDALTTANSIELPWLWFGDSMTHTLEFRTYATAYTTDSVAPLYGAAYVEQAVITVAPYAPTTSLTAPDLGTLVVGATVDTTIDIGSLATSFDWSYGGSVAAVGLPNGLSAELANQSSDDPLFSPDGAAPQLRILGTPTKAGTFTTTFAVTDGMGGIATVARDYMVGTGAVVAPTELSRVGVGSLTFTLRGLPNGAQVSATTSARGVARTHVVGATVRIDSLPGFSGIIKQPIKVHATSKTTTLTLIARVRPTAASVVRISSSAHATAITWKASANATGYHVLVNDHVMARTTKTITHLVIARRLAHGTKISVVALGTDGLQSTKVSATVG